MENPTWTTYSFETRKEFVQRYRAVDSGMDFAAELLLSPNSLVKSTCRKCEHRVVSLRFNRRWRPFRISYHLDIPVTALLRDQSK